MTDTAAFKAALFRLWPNGDQKVPGLRGGIVNSLPAVLSKYKVSSPLVLAHIMAQVSHECGAGHDVVENMNYTASRMTQVWPSRFQSIESAQPFAGNPRALANKVYNGRMGNAPGSDDGYNFRGRGGSQTTGREGYERVAKATGIDVVNHPELLIDPVHFLECSVSDFINCGCMPFALKDDVETVTKRLNGGFIGLAERKVWLGKWKSALGTSAIILTAGPLPPDVPKPVVAPPTTPSITRPAPGSIGALIASIFTAIFKRK